MYGACEGEGVIVELDVGVKLPVREKVGVGEMDGKIDVYDDWVEVGDCARIPRFTAIDASSSSTESSISMGCRAAESARGGLVGVLSARAQKNMRAREIMQPPHRW
jgi:hypothetical protein